MSTRNVESLSEQTRRAKRQVWRFLGGAESRPELGPPPIARWKAWLAAAWIVLVVLCWGSFMILSL